jgi:hypothetical protein
MVTLIPMAFEVDCCDLTNRVCLGHVCTKEDIRAVNTNRVMILFTSVRT